MNWDAQTDLRDRCQFRITLRLELFDAIHHLLNSEARIHLGWRQETIRALPAEFHEAVHCLGRAADLWPAISSSLPRKRATLEFEEVIVLLRRVPLKQLQRRVLRAIMHDDELCVRLINGDLTLKQAVGQAPEAKREWLAHMGLFPYLDDSPLVVAFKVLLDEPDSFREKAVTALTAFWQGGFRETWKLLQPQLQDSIIEKERLFQVCTIEEFAGRALLRVQVDRDTETFKAIRGGYALSFARIARCVFTPSVFNERRYWSALEEGSQDREVHVFFPYFDPALSPDSRPTTSKPLPLEPEPDIALIMKALGDSTRFAIAGLIAKAPMTLTEIARAIDVSKPTITHHVAALRAADLITDLRIGNRARISLNRQTVEHLTGLALERFYKKGSDPSY